MTTIQTIARNIYNGSNNGMFISIKGGKTRNSYSLWEYNLIDGWKLTFTFHKMVGIKAVTEGEYSLIPRLTEMLLTADWHTQASVAHCIMNEVKALKNAANEESGEIPFGKYKGTKISDITDLSYLCWLGNSATKDEDWRGVESWIKEAAIKRANVLGAVQIGNSLIDLNDTNNQFNKNTAQIYKAVQNHEPIEYIAETNDGGIWNAYGIILPTVAVGHSYYGVCQCLKVDGRARKVKGMVINIYDYTVENGVITAHNFVVNRY